MAQNLIPKDLPRPWLKVGVLCEKVLQERDGVVSLIRIVDRFTVTKAGPEPPQEMPEYDAHLYVVMIFSGGLGNFEAQLRIVHPDGKETLTPTMPFFVDSLERGHQIVGDLHITFKKEGLYYIEFMLDNDVVGRTPFRVIYQRVKQPPQIEAKEQ